MKVIELIDPFPHFKRRLKERYGLSINYDQYLEMCDRPCFVIKEQPKNRIVVKMEYEGKFIIAVKYKSKRKSLLVTALPFESFIIN